MQKTKNVTMGWGLFVIATGAGHLCIWVGLPLVPIINTYIFICWKRKDVHNAFFRGKKVV